MPAAYARAQSQTIPEHSALCSHLKSEGTTSRPNCGGTTISLAMGAIDKLIQKGNLCLEKIKTEED